MRKEKTLKILVVEHNQKTLEVVVATLIHLGHGVRAATDIKGALALLRVSKPRPETELVITGGSMEGMHDGITLIRQVKELYPHMRFIFMAKDEVPVHEEYVIFNAGASAILKKSFETEELIAAIEKATGIRQSREYG